MLKKSGQRRGTFYGLGAASTLTMLLLAIIGCSFWSGIARDAAVLVPMKTKTQTMREAGGTEPPTTTRFVQATATRTPLEAAAPTPSPTPSLVYIYFPAVASNPTRAPTLTPVPTDAPFTGKTILVDISDQRVYAYNGGKLVFNFTASTGRKNLTRPGRYKILDKYPRAYSDPWGFWMPYWMGIYYAGYNLENGFHSLPVLSNGTKIWGNKMGTPVTYGCVVLMPNDMKKLYRWAGIGTAVVIQK